MTQINATISEAEMQAGLTSPAAPAATAPAVPTAVRWLTEKKRIETYTLVYPFAIDGVEYRVITIKRLSAAEVSTFVDRLLEDPANLRFPMFFVEGVALGGAAWAAMDDDDRLGLETIANGFLPERFRRTTAAS